MIGGVTYVCVDPALRARLYRALGRSTQFEQMLMAKNNGWLRMHGNALKR